MLVKAITQIIEKNYKNFMYKWEKLIEIIFFLKFIY